MKKTFTIVLLLICSACYAQNISFSIDRNVEVNENRSLGEIYFAHIHVTIFNKSSDTIRIVDYKRIYDSIYLEDSRTFEYFYISSNWYWLYNKDTIHVDLTFEEWSQTEITIMPHSIAKIEFMPCCFDIDNIYKAHPRRFRNQQTCFMKIIKSNNLFLKLNKSQIKATPTKKIYFDFCPENCSCSI